jgi:four helix bundle protein
MANLEVIDMNNEGDGSCGCGGERRNEWRNASGGQIKGFDNLEVYKGSYAAMKLVFQKILPILPPEERFDLVDQLRRSAKAIPRLIAEGHAKRHQNKGFQKYIDDAHAESNETIVSLNQVKDLYAKGDSIEVCAHLIDVYDKISRQLYKLSVCWEKFRKKPPPDAITA